MKIKAYILALSAMALVSEISLKPCMAEDEMQGDFYADQYLEQYTYENMQDDIEKLQEKYGGIYSDQFSWTECRWPGII